MLFRSQFFQTGVECLGLANRDTADKEVLALAIKAVRAAGLSDFSVKIGDLGLFAGLVDALDIPPQWRARLKRHFWRPGYFKALLARLSSEVTKNSDASAALEGLIAQIDAQDAVLGGRTREEIIERLTEQSAEAAAVRLNKRDVALIERVLGISGEASSALANLRNVLREVRVKLDAPLDTMERRLAALGKLGLGRSRVTFAANFGRNMEYYTGFVFELWSRDKEGDVQIAGGGRYDTLLRSLGSKIAHPAVGCAIRGERVLAARRKRGA